MTDLMKFSELRREKMALEGLIKDLEIDPENCDEETFQYYVFLETSLNHVINEMNDYR